MKACPFCAELIQERAVKCRFCGEWLDPTARPAWSSDTPPAAASTATSPPPTTLDDDDDAPGPATTATDGSTIRPIRSWSTPPWLAEREAAAGSASAATLPLGGNAPPSPARGPGTLVSHAPTSAGPVAIAQAAAGPAPTPLSAPAPARPAAVSSSSSSAAGSFHTSAPARGEASAQAPARASLEEVALQMQRLEQSADLMRGEIERGPDPRVAALHERAIPSHPQPAPVVHDELDDPLEHTHRRDELDDELDPPRAPAAGPSTRAAAGFEDAFLGDLDDDGEPDGDWGGDDFGAVAPASRPLPWVPILLGAAVLVVVGGFVFSDALFGPSEATEGEVAADGAIEPAAADGGDAKVAEPAADAKADEAKAAAAPVEGGTGAPAAEGGDTKADPDAGEPVPTPAPAATTLDAASQAKLDEARALYTKAEGRNKRLLGQAGTLLDDVLKVAPGHPEALLIKAQVLLESGSMTDALAMAQRCVQASPDLADCWLTIGVVQQENKAGAEALAAYEKYLALAPEGKYARDVSRQVKKLSR